MTDEKKLPRLVIFNAPRNLGRYLFKDGTGSYPFATTDEGRQILTHAHVAGKISLDELRQLRVILENSVLVSKEALTRTLFFVGECTLAPSQNERTVFH